MWKRVLWLAALAACSRAGGALIIKEATREPSRLGVSVDGDEKKWVKVSTQGADTVIDFRGREFVFKNLAGYEGKLDLDKVDLEIGGADVVITPDKVQVKHVDRRASLLHGGLAPGKRVVYSEGSIWVE